MAKFNATVEFSLVTEIEPENVYRLAQAVEDIDGIGEFDDQCRFGTQSVESDGGSLSFEITAEDEGSARDLIEEAIFDGKEVEDDNGFTWLVESLNIDLEEVEETLTVEEAIQILSDFVDSENDRYPRVAKAAEVILDDHSRLGRRVQDLETRVAGTEEQIRQLSARLQQVTDAACPQPVDQ